MNLNILQLWLLDDGEFWGSVCETVHPILSDRFPVCLSVLDITLVYCGQMVGWIKIKLGVEVDHIVLLADPAPPHPQRGTAHLHSAQISVVSKWLHGSRCHLVWRQASALATLCQMGKPASLPPKFSVHVCCGQMAGWTKMPLGRKVDLGLGNVVLDGDPTPPKGARSLIFLAHFCCVQTAGWIKVPRGTKVGLSLGNIVLDGDPSP